MRLRELTSAGSKPPAGAAPDWLLGTFRRRSITFFTGVADLHTQVLWLQSRGLSADFRVPPDRPLRQGRSSWDDFSRQEIDRLAVNEGGLGLTAWDGSRMKWFDWSALQTHPKWAEPGELRRIGDCVMEFAPSGAYLEDWRLQPSAAGPVIGLRLLHERNSVTGKILHRGGGLIVCGDHAAFVRGRALDLDIETRFSDEVRQMAREQAIVALGAFDASYARRVHESEPFIVELSTNPFREGETLISEEGFSHDQASGLVYQCTIDNGVPVERVFTVDTLEPCLTFPAATVSSQEGQAWLSREADTLLAYATKTTADQMSSQMGSTACR